MGLVWVSSQTVASNTELWDTGEPFELHRNRLSWPELHESDALSLRLQVTVAVQQSKNTVTSECPAYYHSSVHI